MNVVRVPVLQHGMRAGNGQEAGVFLHVASCFWLATVAVWWNSAAIAKVSEIQQPLALSWIGTRWITPLGTAASRYTYQRRYFLKVHQ